MGDCITGLHVHGDDLAGHRRFHGVAAKQGFDIGVIVRHFDQHTVARRGDGIAPGREVCDKGKRQVFVYIMVVGIDPVSIAANGH